MRVRIAVGLMGFAASCAGLALAESIENDVALEITTPSSGSATDESKSAEAEIPQAQLTGEQIYERVLDNRFYSYFQHLVLESGDRAENVQKTELRLKYLSFRGEKEEERFISKSIAKYTKPQDVRHLGYLVIKKPGGKEDQFIYRPSARRVRRINLRGEAVFGTDFSMEDILPREIEDATYQRLPDSEVEGVSVFAVEVVPLPEKDSEYSKFIVYVEDHGTPGVDADRG